jgi:hypothetical protein
MYKKHYTVSFGSISALTCLLFLFTLGLQFLHSNNTSVLVNKTSGKVYTISSVQDLQYTPSHHLPVKQDEAVYEENKNDDEIRERYIHDSYLGYSFIASHCKINEPVSKKLTYYISFENYKANVALYILYHSKKDFLS